MRKTLNPAMERFRVQIPGFPVTTAAEYGATGMFLVPSCDDHEPMKVMSSSALSPEERDELEKDCLRVGQPIPPEEMTCWDHVSISREDRTPTWAEMCYIKDMFFEPTECVMQLHPPRSEHINVHDYCLHLWRPTNTEIPKPPRMMI